MIWNSLTKEVSGEMLKLKVLDKQSLELFIIDMDKFNILYDKWKNNCEYSYEELWYDLSMDIEDESEWRIFSPQYLYEWGYIYNTNSPLIVPIDTDGLDNSPEEQQEEDLKNNYPRLFIDDNYLFFYPFCYNLDPIELLKEKGFVVFNQFGV